MDEYYWQLAGTLRKWLALIAYHLEGRDSALLLEKLKEASNPIDELKVEFPANADPMFFHYIQRMRA